MSQAIHIYLVRHGRTQANTNRILQGWENTPLTEEAIKVVNQAGKGLQDIPFDLSYSSDLGRTIDTAMIILSNSAHPTPELIQDERLREVYYGSNENVEESVFEAAVCELLKQNERVNENTADWESITQQLTVPELINAYAQVDPTNSSEDHARVLARGTAAFADIVDQAQKQGKKRVLVVSHGDLIMTLLTDLFEDIGVPIIKNCGLTHLVYSDGVYSLGSDIIGDLSYLKE